MKAISLWQPWATLMAVGLKKNETRHWPTSYRGQLIIHATKRMESPTILMRELLKPYGYQEWDEFPRGALVCVVEIIDCVRIDNYLAEYPEYQFGDYSSNRYVWITNNLITFENPILFKGSQGFFNVPDEIITNQPIPEKADRGSKQLKLF